jgi:hypothetical protein
MFQHLLHGKPDIFCDLAKQNWRDMSIAVKGDGRTPTIKSGETVCEIRAAELLQNLVSRGFA